MKAVLMTAAVTMIGAGLVVVMGVSVAQDRRTGTRLCAAMLGAPPEEGATVENLSGLQAAALAVGRHPGGEDAYRFVVTLNTITNWRRLPARQILDWLSDPPRAQVPASAQLDSIWPAPEFDAYQPDTQPTWQSLYQQACAMILRRAETRTPMSTPPPPVPAVPSPPSATTAGPNSEQPDRSAVAAAVTGRLGAVMSEPQLWEVISPTPQLDPKRTLFEQLARTSPIASPAPGDLACYDFTTSGPARCSLVIAVKPTPVVATPNNDGILVAEPVPANSTIIAPVSINGAGQ